MAIKNKVLVMGSSSFGGASFVNFILNKNKYKVYGTYRTQKPKVYLSYLENKNIKKFKNFKIDLIKDSKKLYKLIKKIKPNYIVDFASICIVNPSWLFPDIYASTNVNSKIEIIKNLNKFSFLKKYIYISTPEIFGSSSNKIKENSNFFNPSTPYATSKLNTEFLLKNYFNSFKAPIIIARFANFYGSGQPLNRLIPKTIFSIQNNKKFPLEGKGESIRGYIYSYDFCNGIFKIITKGKLGATYHFSQRNFYSVIDVIKTICKAKKYSLKKLIVFKKDRIGKDKCYKLDTYKTVKFLKWKNKFSLKGGIKEITKYQNKKNKDYLNLVKH